MIAERVLSELEYKEWNSEYEKACRSIIMRDSLKAKLGEQIERDLILLGSTGIEDMLQENVTQTIESLKEAGIIVWVLTGDKVETAINIGHSCGLLNKNTFEIVIDSESTQILSKLFKDAMKAITAVKETKQKAALIISGRSLVKMTFNDDLKMQFLQLCEMCEVVIACRVTPA